VLARGNTIKSIIEGDSDPRTFIPLLVQHHLAGRLPFDRLLSIYSFDSINQAFDDVEHGKVIKPLLKVSDA
jgi:aryl-alcohol dehydrogenase